MFSYINVLYAKQKHYIADRDKLKEAPLDLEWRSITKYAVHHPEITNVSNMFTWTTRINSHSGIPRSRDLSLRDQRPNILQLRICQIKKDGLGILIKILDRSCSGNRDDIRALSKKPCDSNLGRSTAVVIGNIFQPLN